MAHAFRVRDQCQCTGADDHTRRQVTNHSAQTQAFGQWHRDHGGEQKDDNNLQNAARFMHEEIPEGRLAGGGGKSLPDDQF
ncbi:hypothetical protein YSKK_25970 [Halopseudomonas aestusnigri]|nr:hypothetical protein YSKK_25970 [Halopseudomonas aestusnigri]